MKDREMVFGSLLAAWALAAGGAEKHMIGHSWDLLAVRPADVARNLDAWAELPLDGVSLAVKTALPDGSKIGYNSVMNDPPWDRQALAEEARVIRQCASRNLKHNFLTTFWAPGKRLAWDDDAAWARFVHNASVVAWLAREGQAKGILIDHEDYPETRQFFRVSGDALFPETAALARRRGAQIMKAMADEYPEITLLSFWLLSLDPRLLEDDDPPAAAAAADDLWPSFLNGMLDALPPGARMVDGNEHGYRYRAERNDFYLAVWRMQNKAIELVAPENRAKYRTQVLSGFGLYLDMYTNPAGSPWYFEELDGSRLNRLRHNFTQALDAAQEYVWVYGEKMDWIKWAGAGRDGRPTWEEKLPGFAGTLAQVRRPRWWAEESVARQRQAGVLTNRLANGTCAPAEPGGAGGFRPEERPPAWWHWQHEKKRPGVFGTDAGKGRGDRFSLCAEGAEQGCFGSSVRVSPGELYAVEAFAQGAAPAAGINWKRNGAWDWSLPGAAFRFGPAGEDGWHRAFGTVRVPEGADELVLLLNVRHAPGERTWFDDAGVYLLQGK
jgi:hypothetical protein